MTSLKKTKQRFNEIDLLKGLAIITMIVSHVFYFQYQLNMRTLNFSSPWYLFLTLFAQVTFITCIGVNLSLSNQSSQVTNKKKKYILKQLRRVLTIAIFACILSYLTYLTHGYKFIKFGILHFASVAILIMMWGVDIKILNLIIVLIIITLFLLKNQISHFLYSNSHPIFGFISGLGYPSYYSMDYFPIVPWLSLVAIGILLGNNLYKNYQRQFVINKSLEKQLNNNIILKIIRTFGKYSFFIYLIHIPILYFILKFIMSRRTVSTY